MDFSTQRNLRIVPLLFFGEVFTRASIRYCVRAGILSGFPGSSFHRPVSTASARFWPSECKMYNVKCKIAELSRAQIILHFQFSILHSSGPMVGARCRPPKSKINLLSADGYSPSTENGGIVPYHDMSRNRSGVECLGRLEGRRSQAENISGSFSMRSSTR